ncbi:hypothetical protein MA16_Dca028979 [Dendrobium catenatum]|uniref:Uncharacterized protein n=1 Tax=Dendrobium catenatum TaxID=906689 RepID=A0A2I0VB22_9ASPA|nr:hypothetical protein MA16_Dca028979 [Dendrobium catenatum]
MEVFMRTDIDWRKSFGSGFFFSFLPSKKRSIVRLSLSAGKPSPEQSSSQQAPQPPCAKTSKPLFAIKPPSATLRRKHPPPPPASFRLSSERLLVNSPHSYLAFLCKPERNQHWF